MNITPTVSLDADVLNLRPDSTGGQLVPVGLPAHIATGNLSPLHQFRHSNGTSTLFLTTGNFLFALSLDGESSTPQSLSVLPSAAKCVIEVGNTIFVMTDDGPFRLDYSSVKGTWTEVGLMPQFPVIRLHAVATSVQSTTIPATQLEGTYSHWSGQLSDADCKTMRTKVLDAYSSLCSQAIYAGSFVQPVMARYQLLDRNGALLYQSAPVMISAGKGFQLSSSLSASVVVGSDGSVISVFDRQPMLNGSGPEVVAQWRGHIDHDCLAWKCAMIAQWYDNALLVIESNTLETENCEGDHNLFILNSLGHTYRNLYYRTSFDNMSKRPSFKVGFHTNSATKTMVINSLIQKVRENAYTERSSTACDEFSTYEIKNNGSFGAKAGYHDDVLMTRAIGLHIATSTPLTIIDDPSNRSNHATSWSSW